MFFRKTKSVFRCKLTIDSASPLSGLIETTSNLIEGATSSGAADARSGTAALACEAARVAGVNMAIVSAMVTIAVADRGNGPNIVVISFLVFLVCIACLVCNVEYCIDH